MRAVTFSHADVKLPHVGEARQSNRFEGWKRAARITFTKDDGPPSVVAVNTKFTTWSEGHGDWPVEPGLERFLVDLFSGAGR